MREFLQRHLGEVMQPSQYVGGEWNSVAKDPKRVRLRVALAFPDTYAIGMSHLGLKILYHILNVRQEVWAERVFSPWPDLEALLRKHGKPLVTMESQTPLSGMDLVGFSLQYELGYTNVLTMLSLGGIPLASAERGERDPLVMAGGVGALTPAVMSDFFDFFVVGDGEEVIGEVADFFLLVPATLSHREKLERLARQVQGIYVPALYRSRDGGSRDGGSRDGGSRDGGSRDGGSRESPEGTAWEKLVPSAPVLPIRTRVVDLETAPFPTTPIVPVSEVTHDRITLEIMRGCVHGCRFCQAGMVKRPLRWRRPETLLDQARKSYLNTGLSEIGLTSLSSSDYPCLKELMEVLTLEFREQAVGLSLPSLRVDASLRELPAIIQEVRKSGLTLAPETGSERLRRVINKPISDQDLFNTIREAVAQGWQQIKLYFMVGLPTETPADIDAVASMINEACFLGRRGRGPVQFNVTVSLFVPKPHTPFQWEGMAGDDYYREAQGRIRGALRIPRVVRLRFADVRRSRLEALLSRGGPETGALVREAWNRGARFDAWDEKFSPACWEQALAALGGEGRFAPPIPSDPGRALPWDMVAAGPSRAFLWRERERAAAADSTPSCQGGECAGCGLEPDWCLSLRRSHPG